VGLLYIEYKIYDPELFPVDRAGNL